MAQVFPPYYEARAEIHHGMCPFVYSLDMAYPDMWGSAEAKYPYDDNKQARKWIFVDQMTEIFHLM